MVTKDRLPVENYNFFTLQPALPKSSLNRLRDKEVSYMDEVKNPVLSDELRRLEEEHHHYAQQLDLLLQKPYPTEEDQLEEVRLKKLKLRLKDQITGLQHGHPALVA